MHPLFWKSVQGPWLTAPLIGLPARFKVEAPDAS